uniref:Uncharacterized protein n=1 Tax=Ixodes ricinus TaxID=34613 RepID=A0A6B0UTA3_IXORI
MSALLDSLQRVWATGSVILVATALAFWIIGVTVPWRVSAAWLTRPMKMGSSELSDSCLATMSTRLERRAMLDVLSTICWGSWRAMASSHISVCRRIVSSVTLTKLAVSVASSARFRMCIMLSEYCLCRFSKCSSAALLSG